MLISNFDRLPIKINHVWPMMTFCVLKRLKVQTQTSLQQCMNKIHHHVIQNLRNTVVSIASMTHRYHYHLQTTMKLFFIKKIK